MPTKPDKFSAAEQGLGYFYQGRFALLRLMQLPEDTAVLLEKDDDVDFEVGGIKSLGSLKHKAVGDRLSDLSTDFWKSVRIWLVRYERDGRAASSLRFFLFTTGTVSETSFLRYFLPNMEIERASVDLPTLVAEAAASSKSELVAEVAEGLRKLTANEIENFVERISIVDNSPRIVDVPAIVMEQHMRSIRRELRPAVFQRLEGWWTESVINLLAGVRVEPLFGYQVSDRLSAFAEEYRADNLPVTYRGKIPTDPVDADADPRRFVMQLRAIELSSSRIRNAILDYYRAFEQRSAWARQDLLISGEMEAYEERLVAEWERYRDVLFEHLDPNAAAEQLVKAGRALYDWAELESTNMSALRIRERVTEPYVVRGGYHILANESPRPSVYWHPLFLDRISQLLSGAK